MASIMCIKKGPHFAKIIEPFVFLQLPSAMLSVFSALLLLAPAVLSSPASRRAPPISTSDDMIYQLNEPKPWGVCHLFNHHGHRD